MSFQRIVIEFVVGVLLLLVTVPFTALLALIIAVFGLFVTTMAVVAWPFFAIYSAVDLSTSIVNGNWKERD